MRLRDFSRRVPRSIAIMRTSYRRGGRARRRMRWPCRAPMVADSAHGIAFAEAALDSRPEGGRWIELESESELWPTSSDNQTQ